MPQPPPIARSEMPNHIDRTALVTGASSGLGLEAAAQLAKAGYTRVIITARTDEKAQAARRELQASTAVDGFETLTLDLDDLASVTGAADSLVERGGQLVPGMSHSVSDGASRYLEATTFGPEPCRPESTVAGYSEDHGRRLSRFTWRRDAQARSDGHTHQT